MIELKPETPIQYLKGVGPRVGALFQKLNVHTVEAFCFFFPRSYEDRRKLPLISQVQAGEQVCLYGTIKSISEKKVSKNTLIHCILEDRSGSIVLTWFNQPFLLKQLKRFSQLVVKGKAVYNSFEGSIQLHVTEFEGYVNPEQSRQAIGSIIPIYPLTKGLSQFHCRSVARQIFHLSSVQLKELYPPHLRDYLNLIPLNAAVRHLHFPSQTQLFEQARYRIVFDEFFTYQLRLAQRGYTLSEEISAEPLDISGPLIDSYLKSLPYALTQAQKQAIEEIKKDISSRTCMNRLLQGDVGSGKTDVAIMGLLFAIQSGKVAAVMVPTEVLAQQHYLKLSSRLGHLGVQVLLLKGKMKVKKKREAMAMLEQDKNLIIVGTHALIQEAVKVKNLGMIIVDEQHRFGVIQRAMFKQKGLRPHALFMTATPIPRTFMLTSFGDLKKSIINEMPPGRVPPKTYCLSQEKRDDVYGQCQKKIKKGEQVYIVFPLIEESEKLDLSAAMQGYNHARQFFSDCHVGLMHGRLPSEEKQAVMKQYKENKIQVLVATTVIEVGVDVPNATSMVIHDAQRFGLSQLHQLRGRIGRGQGASTCYLLSNARSENAKKRLQIMVSTHDGFRLAEEDLLIRGPGDMLGTKQSGIPDFNLGDIIKDEAILIRAREVAQKYIAKDPLITNPNYGQLKKQLKKQEHEFLEPQLN